MPISIWKQGGEGGVMNIHLITENCITPMKIDTRKLHKNHVIVNDVFLKWMNNSFQIQKILP